MTAFPGEILDWKAEGNMGAGDVIMTCSYHIAPLKKRWRTVVVVICAVRMFSIDRKYLNAQCGVESEPSTAAMLGLGVVVPAQPSQKKGNINASHHRGGTSIVDVQLQVEEGEEILLPISNEKQNQEIKLGVEKLAQVVREKKLDVVEEVGGVAGLARLLQTDIDGGISPLPQHVQNRRRRFGDNCYPRKPPRPFFKFVAEALFGDTTVIILLLCAMLSLGFGIKSDGPKDGWYDGASIALAVLLVVSVSAISNYRQYLQFQKLSQAETSNARVEVVRGGRRFPVSIEEVVVGDIVALNIGDQVPADGFLVGGHSLEIDESSMSGESDLVHKYPSIDPLLISGTKVANGYASMLVTAVGTNTEWGRMMTTISQHSSDQTPLQIRLNGLTAFVGKIGLSVAFIVLVVLLIRYFTGNTNDDNGHQAFVAGQTKASEAVDGVVDIIAIAVTIVVVAIPEGLPLAVTLTLAYSMKRMMADNALVRKLSACETMGSATTICTDKTGTLTRNVMTVTRAWVAGEMTNITADADDLPSDKTLSPLSEILLQGIGLNTTGSVYVDAANSESGAEVCGSPTEKAILTWALKLGMNSNDLKSKYTILNVEAFNSEKKRSGVAIKELKTGEGFVHWKGAAEMILSMCSKRCSNASSEIEPIGEEERESLKRVIQGMAASSLRCIAFAYTECAADIVEGEGEAWKMAEDGLTLLAIAGLKDPCRPGVARAIESCRAAGVKVRMVTGDNIYTAKAIAVECGILDRNQIEIAEEPLVVEGEVFRNYSAEQRRECVEKICVMARSSPSDKLLMVQTLRERGHVVAVTGDGTNDAPALQEADIGVAMGIQGTQVAKESSDIVILDDNFSSGVTVVRWGRTVYANIQKFIQFQLTVNAAALVINFVAAVSSGDVPLTAVQLLWVNMIMDTLGALALATEPPTDELMRAPPVGRSDPLITNIMWRNLIPQAIYQIAVLLTLKFKGTAILNLEGDNRNEVNNTMIFNTFVLCQLE
eukprot:Gb_21309 [translate_table: standard]